MQIIYKCYNKIDIFEGIDVSKRNTYKDCSICHYWHFLDKGFKYQSFVCNGCHVVLMMFMNHNNIAIYQCIMSRITKSEAINLLKNSALNEKSGSL